ncbi:YopX family protein [Lactiplantibacillus plantarum]|uniref:YopX family protein n=1 Tax=Lactiplantibacillus TaxID=2767842 RepID=UPI001C27716C|nr:YopX family protein [Lactiplantibacillus plantarum]MBU8890917.1 YopX family protein [Lactiplantibacillus plantarum]MBW2758027.1 YopX family protein [Lactiplantibacillus plantarum]
MIKFRAWDNECKVIREYDELKGLTLDALDASDFKLEQFTGLKDMNGKEIYEGDILHFGSTWCVGDEYDPREEEHIGLVEYRPDYASYVVNCNEKIYPLEQVISFDGYSVHGNAHENPELLKG